MKSHDPLLAKQCKLFGLHYPTISMHQERVRLSLKGENIVAFKIKDTCRLDNQGVLPQAWLTDKENAAAKSVIGFIPAAGASSRYFECFQPLQESIRIGDSKKMWAEVTQLKQTSIEQYSLPSHLKKLFQQDSLTSLELYLKDDDTKNKILEELYLPKALLPCVRESNTYLELKVIEHKHLELGGQVFVLHPNAVAGAKKLLQSLPQNSLLPFEFMLQDAAYSTIRFDHKGEPVLDENQSISPVPAGHGTLVKLLPKVKKHFPHAHSILVRNVDNVMGTGEEATQATRRFLSQHEALLNSMHKIRQGFDTPDLAPAAAEAEKLLARINVPAPTQEIASFLNSVKDKAENSLWRLQFFLFHFDLKLSSRYFPGLKGKDLLRKLYARPTNSFGQVPNTQHDVGGSPVFAKMQIPDEANLKICLELPHVLPEDRKAFLENHAKATHFNPVFVAAEIDLAADAYEEKDLPLWILAKKSFKGQTVYYHESVLYELLGNSLLANVVFLEVPRCVFNPHKSLADTVRNSLKDWLG